MNVRYSLTLLISNYLLTHREMELRFRRLAKTFVRTITQVFQSEMTSNKGDLDYNVIIVTYFMLMVSAVSHSIEENREKSRIDESRTTAKKRNWKT